MFCVIVDAQWNIFKNENKKFSGIINSTAESLAGEPTSGLTRCVVAGGPEIRLGASRFRCHVDRSVCQIPRPLFFFFLWSLVVFGPCRSSIAIEICHVKMREERETFVPAGP